MATNPKIEIFEIDIAKHDGVGVTFDDLFHALLMKEEYEKDQNILFLDFFAHFIGEIDTGSFHNDTKDRKVMTAYDTDANPESITSTIHPASEREIISGTIQGGAYGSPRTLSKLGNKLKREEIGNDGVILDQFYFLLHTPLDDDKGVLILQSYSSENIKKLFQSFLKKLFTPNKEYKVPQFNPFIPAHLREEFREKSQLAKFTFNSRVLASKLSSTSIITDADEYNINISITPVKKPNQKDGQKIVKKLSNLPFGNMLLGSFKHKKVVLKDPESGNEAGFEIDNDFSLRPTIYLEGKVNIDSGNIPNFEELNTYCNNLLKEHIAPVLYPNL